MTARNPAGSEDGVAVHLADQERRKLYQALFLQSVFFVASTLLGVIGIYVTMEKRMVRLETISEITLQAVAEVKAEVKEIRRNQ